MFRLGFTMAEVGQHFGMTRQTVWWILRKMNVNSSEGGQAVMTPEKWERLRKKKRKDGA